jgi:hypothetical protein
MAGFIQPPFVTLGKTVDERSLFIAEKLSIAINNHLQLVRAF